MWRVLIVSYVGRLLSLEVASFYDRAASTCAALHSSCACSPQCVVPDQGVRLTTQRAYMLQTVFAQQT